VDTEVDALYALPPDEFVAARDGLVKRLRAEQRRDDADVVKALRRPSMAAWAVNQLARRHPDAVDQLVAAGGQLGAAQRRALSGVKDAGIQQAAAARRQSVEELWRLAESILAEQGSSPAAQRQPVVETLEAASVTEEAAEAVRAGRLTNPLPAPSDFGAVSGFAVVAGEPEHDAAGTSEDPEAARRREQQQHAHAAAEQADRAERHAGDARQKAMREQAEAERLERQADEAARRATRARQEAAAATARADELETTAAQARGEAERLAAELDAPA
jgi:hypothetical protein